MYDNLCLCVSFSSQRTTFKMYRTLTIKESCDVCSICFWYHQMPAFRARTNGSPKARILRVGFSIPICNLQRCLARSIFFHLELVLFYTVKFYLASGCFIIHLNVVVVGIKYPSKSSLVQFVRRTIIDKIISQLSHKTLPLNHSPNIDALRFYL